jgi:hypothetical protein
MIKGGLTLANFYSYDAGTLIFLIKDLLSLLGGKDLS